MNKLAFLGVLILFFCISTTATSQVIKEKSIPKEKVEKKQKSPIIGPCGNYPQKKDDGAKSRPFNKK